MCQSKPMVRRGAERLLRCITFSEPGPAGSWREWYGVHGSEGRLAWFAHAQTRLRCWLENGEFPAAAEFVRKHCLPRDPLALELAVDCVEYPEMQTTVAQLLRPSLCPQLRCLINTAVSKLASAHTGDPDDVVRAILTRRQLVRLEWRESLGVLWWSRLDP